MTAGNASRRRCDIRGMTAREPGELIPKLLALAGGLHHTPLDEVRGLQ
jgi:hypothetical protein